MTHHAGALKPWGTTLPWAWPHDGLAHDRTSGEQLAESYRRHGLNLLGGKAEFDDPRRAWRRDSS